MRRERGDVSLLLCVCVNQKGVAMAFALVWFSTVGGWWVVVCGRYGLMALLKTDDGGRYGVDYGVGRVSVQL